MNAGDKLGKYRLTRCIGDGAMGVVWAAVNEDTHKEVALKLLSSPNEELRRRLVREAKACGRLDHRNIVAIYDAGTTPGGEPFLVMQLLSGESLARRLQRAGRLPAESAAAVGAAIAAGLGAAHAEGIVHRDLKPDNVFLHREPGTPGDVVKILDFGISRVEIKGDATGTATGALLGSPAYMSPEQARGSSEVGPRSDLWSLGVVLFEMLAGVRPFPGQTAADAIAQVLAAPIPSLASYEPRLPADLVSLVHACLDRDIERRPSSAAEVADRLLAHVLEEPSGRRSYVSLPSAVAPDADDEEGVTNILGPMRMRAMMMAPVATAKVDAPAPLSPAASSSHGLPQANVDDEEEIADEQTTAPAAPRPRAPTFGDAPLAPAAPRRSSAEQTAVLAVGALAPSPAFRPRSSEATASSSTTPLTRAAPERPAPSPRVRRSPGGNWPVVLAIVAIGLALFMVIAVLVLRGRHASDASAQPAAATVAEVLHAAPSQLAPSAPAPVPAPAPAPAAADDPPPPVAATAAAPATRHDTPMITLTIQANVPARVFLDDQLIGVTPLAPISVRPGQHKLRFNHTVLGERTVLVNAKAKEPLRVLVDFAKRDVSVELDR